MKLFLIALTAALLVGCNSTTNQTPNTNQSTPNGSASNSVMDSTQNDKNTNLNQNLNRNEQNGVTNNQTNGTSQGTNNGNASNSMSYQENTTAPSEAEAVNPNSTIKSEQDVAEQTYEKITHGIAVHDVTMGPELFRDTYGIDPDILLSYVVCMPESNAEPSEIAVFELKNETASDTVKLSIENRIEALTEKWGAQNFQMAEKGNVIIFIMNPQAEQMIQNFANA